MANQEQLEILKRGVKAWNNWRNTNLSTDIDLAGADLKKANLTEAYLSKAKLVEANLGEANLERAKLVGCDLSKAKLNNANLSRADLLGADLSVAHLKGTNFEGTCLWETNLRGVNLLGANLVGADLKGADLKNALIGSTLFVRIDLSVLIGLEEVHHYSPSTVDTQTIRLSKGKIPEKFLRGCGLSDVEIESAKLANPNLTNEEINKILYRIYDLRATQSIQINPLFISYSHADKEFVDHLDSKLTEKGVRFWRDIHDAKAGRLETQIDLAIRQNPTVLLILSKNSLSSDWVEHEVRHARKLEKELGRDALCPIALDDAWKSSPWPERIMEQVMEYNILDFSGWQDVSTFESKFAKLLSGLEIFYKKPAS